VDILGYQVSREDVQACADEVLGWIRVGDRCRWAACLNPHSYVVGRANPAFRDALTSADWLVPDGVGIVLASRLLGRPVPRRVTGFDLFAEIHRQGEMSGYPLSVFLLGSTEDTLSRVRERLHRDHPGIRVAGSYSPPFAASFTAEQNAAMVDAVNAAGADVLWVSMTAPKQELWLHQHQEWLQVRFAAAVGAVFDFYTGKVRRSHPVAQRLGLEWLPRLLREPRRLWRRTFVSAPTFMWEVFRAMARERVSSRGRP
jgi:N-acetylglucosaminyldiphosphoundecaprenol N-acetyl-beta-D-mannosaminyltransferase